MALRLALRRSATTSSVFERQIYGGDRFTTPFLFSRASYFTGSRHTVSIYTQPVGQEFRCRLDEFSLNRGKVDENMNNPFKVTGPPGSYEVRILDDGLFARIEMPGVDKEDVGVKIEDGKLEITAKGQRQSPHLEEDGAARTYSGRLDFPAGLFDEKLMSYELKNGVLRVFMPNMNNN